MGCWPWRTGQPNSGAASVLQRLRGEPLACQAQLALQIAVQNDAEDLAFFDVAACLSGLTPAWTGGPLTWLWAEQATQRAGFDTASGIAWELLEPRLRQSCA